MNKELLMVADTVSAEKGVDREIIIEALEAALASATRKRHGDDIDVRVAIDRETGAYDTFRRWLVFEDESPDLEFPERELRMIDAVDVDKNAEPGGFVEVPMESVEFGRIAAQTAKQVIVQKVREAERAKVAEEYDDRIGDLIGGAVKRMDRRGAYVDLGGNIEAFIPRENLIPREPLRPQDRVKGLLVEVRTETRGPQLILTRTSPEFLIELFKLEVPEVGQGLIDIIGAARDPGLRAKIGVKSNDSRIDPVGACVGMRGSRVQAVSNELAGERVDIILGNENPAQYVINAMSPAEVTSIVVDEDSHGMDLAVEEDKLSQAIGRGGQNIRLASQLTGWELNVMTEADAEVKTEEESKRLILLFSEKLAVDEEVASILVQEGFSSIEEIAYVPESELVGIEEFDETMVKELRERARDVLLTMAISGEGASDDDKTSINNLPGMDATLQAALEGRGITNRDELAELAVDELMEIDGMDEERAGKLILAARAHWFEEAEAEAAAAEQAEADTENADTIAASGTETETETKSTDAGSNTESVTVTAKTG
ncbi:MAG: transcription termination/antitermination protein NusA [Gammaproteobacteria bacterium]|nr:transcription termination/antitermination protein NusA [Gammaproteobacteria bacterium]